MVYGVKLKGGKETTHLVEAAVQLHNNLARTVIIDNLKLINVTYVWVGSGLNKHVRR